VTRSIVFSRDGVILNACCLRNIYASGCMVAILGALPIPTMIARIAYQEQPLRIFRENKEGEGLVVEHIDLQPALNAGLLVVASLSSEAEEVKMINLATVLEGDAEATSAALALQRRWAIGVDGPATTGLFRQHLPDVPIVSTPILVQHWVERSRPPFRALRAALQNIHQGTGYTPPVYHPLYPWWQEVLETTNDESM
jgi:hypothetical protein